jgi:hypothetical protein
MSNIVQGSDYRFTLLTERLIRLEYSSSGEFEDRNTQLVANRDFEPVNYSVLKDHNGHEVEIETEFFHLYYDGGPFAASNLHVDAKYQYTLHDSRWYYGEKASGNLGGTNPTLDLGRLDADRRRHHEPRRLRLPGRHGLLRHRGRPFRSPYT